LEFPPELVVVVVVSVVVVVVVAPIKTPTTYSA
jgi:hypothetical protein